MCIFLRSFACAFLLTKCRSFHVRENYSERSLSLITGSAAGIRSRGEGRARREDRGAVMTVAIV